LRDTNHQRIVYSAFVRGQHRVAMINDAASTDVSHVPHVTLQDDNTPHSCVSYEPPGSVRVHCRRFPAPQRVLLCNS